MNKTYFNYKVLKILLSFLFLIPNVSFAEVGIYQKAEQMIIMGFSGASARNSDVSTILNQMNLGGVIFFDYDSGTKKYKRNFSNTKDLSSLIKEINTSTQTPSWIAIDEEGGMVSRLKVFNVYGKTNSAKDISVLSNSKIKEIFSWRAKNIAQYGFNMNFAPVVDLCYDGRVMSNQKRCFDSKPTKVFSIANLFALELKNKNVAPVFKHYPGIGSGVYDTHLKPVDITNTTTQNDLLPFELACKKNTNNIVMFSHVVDSNVDTFPASMSKPHVDNLRSLGCENALIISDDMDMKAITNNYNLEEVLKHSINAGVDMIIISNNINAYDKNKYKDVQKTLYKLIDNGEVSKEKIELAYDKIIEYKKIYKVINY